jgi:hypothetical protein
MELPAANHGWQLYHYDLQPGELASNLVNRFEFQSGSAATNNRIYLDQITVKTASGGSSTSSVAMLDDGAHHDGAPGDGVYGAQIPAYPLGTTVRYYVHAEDAATRQFTDPSGAPINTNLFAYTVVPRDSVGDGIPDWWRAQYFGGTGTTTNAWSCATADPDQDGVDNYREYIANESNQCPLLFTHPESNSSFGPGMYLRCLFLGVPHGLGG